MNCPYTNRPKSECEVCQRNGQRLERGLVLAYGAYSEYALWNASMTAFLLTNSIIAVILVFTIVLLVRP